MNTNRTELLAAWIVAIALVVAMSVHAVLPKTPPRVAPGVTNVQPRPALPGRDLAGRLPETDLPLVEYVEPSAEGANPPL